MSEIVIRHYARPANRVQLGAGIVMAAIALLFALEQSALWLAAHPMAANGVQASLLAGLATGLGALPALWLRRAGERAIGPLLGMAGGMMLAASLFSLLLPAAFGAAASSAPVSVGVATVVAAILGAWAMQRIDRRTAHVHIDDLTAGDRLPDLSLAVAAIALHNLPEGLAVGVAVAAGVDHGMSVGIALQNIPEGWVVASAMLLLGATPLRAVLYALATGLVEPVGGLIGAIASTVAGAALPLALAGAAGAMIWVVMHELLPAALRSGRQIATCAALAAGFALMAGLGLVI
jgi:ZIP family zinc transporter